MKPYDFIFACGANCACAMHLRRNGLRDMSSPLDWVGIVPDLASRRDAPLCRRIDLIVGGFTELLEDRSRLQKLEKPPGERDGDPLHDYYRDVGNGLLYYHEFATGVPLESTFPEVKARYVRRIANFYSRLERSKRVLIVCWHAKDEFREENSEYERAVQRMRQRFPGREFHLLVLENDATMARGTAVKVHVADGVDKFVGRFCPENGLLGDAKLVSRCLRGIPRNLDVRIKDASLRLRRGLAGFLSVWHLSSAARRSARDGWLRRFHATRGND